MNSNILTISSVLAAIAILPVSTVAAGIILVATGILAVFAADYGRAIVPLTVRAEIIPFDSSNRATDCRDLAA